MRNRYYDPKSRQFTQEDPIGLAGGLNLYGFAHGDPVNFSDPYGLCPTCDYDGDGQVTRSEQWAHVSATTSSRLVRHIANVSGVLATAAELPGVRDAVVVLGSMRGGGRGGTPKPSPNFLPPSHKPQLPPSSLPEGFTVRVMPSTSQYPNGYWKVVNAGNQAVSPTTLKPSGNVSQAQHRADTHVPLPPPTTSP